MTFPCDARAVANEFLDMGDVGGVALTNMALQKLVYLAHGGYALRTGRPLATNHFEAWEMGPVVRCLYEALKIYGSKPVTSRVSWFNALENRVEIARAQLNELERGYLRQVFDQYGRRDAFELSRIKDTLDKYALTYEIRRTEQERPTLSTMAKEFRQIEAAAYRLLEALHVTSKSQDLPEELQRGLYDTARRQVDARRDAEPAMGFTGHRSFGPHPMSSLSAHIEVSQSIRSAVDGVVTLAELARLAAVDREQRSSASRTLDALEMPWRKPLKVRTHADVQTRLVSSTQPLLERGGLETHPTLRTSTIASTAQPGHSARGFRRYKHVV